MEFNSVFVQIIIKSFQTYHPDFFKGLNYYTSLSGIKKSDCFLIYAGKNEMKTSNGELLNWQNIEIV